MGHTVDTDNGKDLGGILGTDVGEDANMGHTVGTDNGKDLGGIPGIHEGILVSLAVGVDVRIFIALNVGCWLSSAL